MSRKDYPTLEPAERANKERSSNTTNPEILCFAEEESKLPVVNPKVMQPALFHRDAKSLTWMLAKIMQLSKLFPTGYPFCWVEGT